MATATKSRRTRSLGLQAEWKPQFWETVDQRSVLYREIKTRLEELRQDVGVNCMQQDLLCQEVIFISLQLETMRVRALEEGEFDQGVYTQMVNCLSGLISKLGLDKAPPKALDLSSYQCKVKEDDE